MASAIKTKAAKILRELSTRYPLPTTQLQFENPWELLVATELAAQCTDARVNQITPAFFARWPGPAELALADPADVEEVIHSTGFFHNKARNLIAAAKMVCQEYGGVLPATMEDLLKLPGVARKTANVVLFAGFGINAGIAVDTHVKRVAYRLGLTEHTDPVRIEKDLVEIVPRKEWGNLNHRLVWFGREVCKARKPACENCELSGLCAKRITRGATSCKNETESEASHESESSP